MKLSKKERLAFDKVLESLLPELPGFVQQHLQEITLIVEDEPSNELLKSLDMDLSEPSDLCGLHHGVSLTERSFTENQSVSPTIYLFRGPIYRSLDDSDTLEEQIRITLIHEIAHHFGFSDEELEELGYG